MQNGYDNFIKALRSNPGFENVEERQDLELGHSIVTFNNKLGAKIFIRCHSDDGCLIIFNVNGGSLMFDSMETLYISNVDLNSLTTWPKGKVVNYDF